MAYKFSFKLSEMAQRDLDDIISYIAISLSNKLAATHFANKFRDAVDEARDFPESGVLVENEFLFGFELRKKYIGNYIMYYLPIADEKMIYIVRIIYGKRNMEEIFRHMKL